MDKTFQTSFIPKKPLAEPEVQEKVGLGLFGFVGILVFVISAGLAAGVYFYSSSLQNELAAKQAQLNNARNILESPLIDSAKILGRRITDANQILSNHIVVSPIFQALQLNTLKSIQFNHFSYIVPVNDKDKIKVEMAGVARDYASIALESDQLAKNKNILNPIFSGLSLDPQTGNVTFTFNFSVDPSMVSFANHVGDYIDPTSLAASTTSSSTSVKSSPVSNQPVTNNTVSGASQ